MLGQSKPSLVLDAPTHAVSGISYALKECSEIHLVLLVCEQTKCLFKAESCGLKFLKEWSDRVNGEHVSLVVLALPCTVSLS
jgi:hypothetical protein